MTEQALTDAEHASAIHFATKTLNTAIEAATRAGLEAVISSSTIMEMLGRPPQPILEIAVKRTIRAAAS